MSGGYPPAGQPGPYGPPQEPDPTQLNPLQPNPGQYPAQPNPGQYPTQPYPAQPYPAQPYPAQPYPGEQYPAYGPQPTPTEQYAPIPGYPPSAPPIPGQPGQPYGFDSAGYGYGPQQFGPGGPPQPPKRSGAGKVLLIVGAAVLALVVLAGVGIALLVSRATPTTGPGSSTGPGSIPPSSGRTSAPASANPSDAVQTYLKALGSGDAASALALSVSQPAEQSLLTSSVLAQANRNGGVSHISVAPVTDQGARSVPATYQVGKAKVSERFAVTKVGDQWKLDQAYAQLDLSGAQGTAFPLTVNNVRTLLTRVSVFPGTYVLGTGSSFASYGSPVVVTKPGQVASTAGRGLRITNAGSQRLVGAAQSSLNRCLRQRQLAPANCPFAASAAGYKIQTSTIDWKVIGGSPLAHAKAQLVPGGTKASTTVNLTIKGSAHCSKTGFSGTCSVTVRRRATASAELTAKTLSVVWVAKRR